MRKSHSTVMGPEQSSNGLSATEISKFNAEQDNLVWRKNVLSWIELISARATLGEDKNYKPIFATLGNQLYEKGLPQAQKNIVDEAQIRRMIDFKQDNQIIAVKEIVDIVAVEQSISVITRLIDIFNHVMQCER